MPVSNKNTAEATSTSSVKKKFQPEDNKEEAESEQISASNIFPVLTA
jgi:hypothetical protein